MSDKNETVVYGYYKHIPDDKKKKPGRPRKYHDGYTERTYKKKIPSRFSKSEIGIKLFGKPIVQLDYFTGEYIDEYPSMSTFAKDYYIDSNAVSKALNRNPMPFAYIHKEQLLFMLKEDYERMMKRDQ